MDISTIQPRQGKLEVQGVITEKGEARAFNKFGKEGKVAKAKLKDSSGEITLTLWNEQVEQVKVGDTIKISNGWSDEYQGDTQLSTGRFGTLTVISSGGGAAPAAAHHAAPKPASGQSHTEVDEEDIEY